jgi:hypothetical protein
MIEVQLGETENTKLPSKKIIICIKKYFQKFFFLIQLNNNNLLTSIKIIL